MKKFFFTICTLIVASQLLNAQQWITDDRRYITVTGSAEVNVQPDEIELDITLKEYGDDPFRTALNSIENQFFAILRKHDIPEEKVIFDNANYYWYYWWRYRNDSYKEKRYCLKLDKSTDFLALVKDLNIKGVSKIDIGSTTNAQLQELRKEVKIMAVQAAKDKATYLLESIGEKPGRVLAVEEVSDYGYNNYSMSKQSNMVAQTTPSGEEIENLATIKLRFEIKAKFEIAE